MQYYSFDDDKENLPSIIQKNSNIIKFPCLILQKDSFNDFGIYHTTFKATCYKSESDFIYVGKVKILHNGINNTVLPKKFNDLDDNFCSIGQETILYIRIYNFLGENKGLETFCGINDVLFSNKNLSLLIKSRVFQESLLRFSEPKKIFKRGKDGILQDIRINNGSKEEYIDAVFKLAFEVNINNSFNPHYLELDFTPNEFLPFRAQVIIGKNGTGKTTVLSNMSNILAGKKVKEHHGHFKVFNQEKNKYVIGVPEFRRVISISNSPFIVFPESNAFSYIHRTLRESRIENIKKQIKSEYALITERKREQFLFNLLSQIIDFDGNSYDNLWPELFSNPENSNNLAKLSSGQIFLLMLLVYIIANIEYESFILLDEPDLYLHPNAINKLIKGIHVILEYFHSYSVITTHSPFVLQNVPSKYVNIFIRKENEVPVQKLKEECFGASVSAISKEVFNFSEGGKFYLDYLNKLADKFDTDEIMNIFGNDLSMSAAILIETIISNKSRDTDEKFEKL